MYRSRIALYSILIGIPVLFILFLLAIVNVIFLFLGIIILLCVLIIIKKKFPDMFTMNKETSGTVPPTIGGGYGGHHKVQVYMVLTGYEDFGARRIAINKTSYSIGRAVDNDYVIDGGKISRHHVTIEYNPVENVCYAIDTGSVNGTFLNSNRMIEGQRYRLIQGDHLMIDDRTFVVEYAHY